MKDYGRIVNDLEELKHLKLIPRCTNHAKIDIIARLLGAILTDGSITNTVEFYLGTEEDATEINGDISSFGFSTNPISLKRSNYNFDDEHGEVTYRTHTVNKGGAFKRFMMALGAPTGRHTLQAAVLGSLPIRLSLKSFFNTIKILESILSS
ncbi:MAG: hypothetical protein ACFFD4_03255 [Candidatus Odinarchaeota archaeon]